MHSRTLESLDPIAAAVAVDLVAYSRDGDPLAVVEIPRHEADRLVRLPEAIGHVFRTRRRRGGRVEVEALRNCGTYAPENKVSLVSNF